MKLTRFWFRFEPSSEPTPLNLGVGVTAWTYADAIALLKEHVFPKANLPPIIGTEENVDISTLDPKHVLPNIGIVVQRGVWFPRGYS